MGRVLIVLALTGAVSFANAGLVDNFSAAPTAVTTTAASSLQYSSSVSAGALGGTRYLGQKFFGAGNRAAAGNADGTFNVSTPFGSETVTSLIYGNIISSFAAGSNIDGFETPDWAVNLALSNFSLDGNAVRLNFVGNEQTLFVNVFLGSESGSTRYSKTVAGNQFLPFTVDLTGADIVSNSTTTLASFDSILFTFRSTNSGDFELGSIETVPEPASMAALAIGAVALLRRRKNS